MSASPTNFTLTGGQSTSTTVTLTSKNKFNGTVALGYVIGGNYPGSNYPGITYRQSMILLTSTAGSNSTTATITTAITTPKGLYIISLWAQIPNISTAVDLYVTVT
jgi:hypothetical protein